MIDIPKPIRQVARDIGKNRQFVRELIEKGEVPAIRDGGSDDAPRLRVKVGDVIAAMERLAVYIPKRLKRAGGQRSRLRRKDSGILHPAALGMRKRGAKHE